jgi:hypothetical protein
MVHSHHGFSVTIFHTKFSLVLSLNRLELPKDRTVGVRADEEKNIEEALEPILRQSGLDIKDYDICLVSQ